MAGDDDDDYLSDKYLVTEDQTSGPKTYAERRKEALRQSRLKNETGRTKSLRQRELEAREEGLRKSLFERAKEEEADQGTSNKALNIMMKMGFKPGQSLGRSNVDPADSLASPSPAPHDLQEQRSGSLGPSRAHSSEPNSTPQHKVEPLPLNEWRGKQGIGLGKRAASPGFGDRIAKMAKMAEDASHEDFRDRTRREFEEKRAEGRLVSAQRTCMTLDEKAGKSFNILWLNPHDPESFPAGLFDALSNYALPAPSTSRQANESNEIRLKKQMQADALQPLIFELDDDSEKKIDQTKLEAQDRFSSDTLEEAAHFLRLGARDRLRVLLAYLRETYLYCFWCGTQYDDSSDLAESCPGINEDDHD